MHRIYIHALAFATLAAAISGETLAEEPAAYRTDANSDASLPWFQPVPGEFPPEDAAHYISGELIRCDHVKREVTLRVDRNDSQSRDEFDHPVTATMLPYGVIYYHGAPAALQDVPVGTHLHGWFFINPDEEARLWQLQRGKLTKVTRERISPEVDFTQCLRLEDDFSYHARRNQIWKVTEVDLAERNLYAVLEKDGQPIGKPLEFHLLSSSRVFVGNGFGTLKDIQPGQHVQMNLTWATLYGPGRVLQIWLDEASQQLATEQQLQRHRDYVRERGIAGWVDAVDDKQKHVTITFFEGVDPALFKDMKIIVPEPLGWPTSGGAKDDLAPKGTIAVATEKLITYDPVNDRKGGNILETNRVPAAPGSSGVQIKVQCGMLLEGYRPTKVVRFYPAAWNVVALPLEERYFGRE